MDIPWGSFRSQRDRAFLGERDVAMLRVARGRWQWRVDVVLCVAKCGRYRQRRLPIRLGVMMLIGHSRRYKYEMLERRGQRLSMCQDSEGKKVNA